MNKIIKAFIIFPLLLSYSVNSQGTDTIHVRAGWNMISLPLKVQDAYYLTIFPGAISYPLTIPYDEYPDTILQIGKSYWIKFASDTTYFITGEPIHSLIDDLDYVGWHMVGSISYPVPVKNIKIDSAGIIRSDFFRYNPASGYEKSDTIKPGFGYWIKVDRECNLTLTSMGYPCPGMPTIEYEGKIYHTVQIGDQCWLRENLDLGTMIQGGDTARDNAVIEKYCYNNDTANCNIYGGFYQWSEAMQYTTTEGAQGICPPVWHIPTQMDYDSLVIIVGYDGNVLKAVGQGSGDGVGTNTSGFSALLSGGRRLDGHFYTLGHDAFLWSSKENGLTEAKFFYLHYITINIYINYFNKGVGFSVRCIKD